MIRYVEPYPTASEPASLTITIPLDMVVAKMKSRALGHGGCYLDEEEALKDFIAINWAWEVEV